MMTETGKIGMAELPPEEILYVSHGQLSIARLYGGCVFSGHHYTYLKDEDKLVRDDVLKKRKKDLAALKKQEREKWKGIQQALEMSEGVQL